jgi:hypothetical protein
MAYDPMSFFKIGQELGKSKRSTFGRGAENMMDQFKEDDSLNKELGKALAVEKIKTSLISPRETAAMRKDNAIADAYSSEGGVQGSAPGAPQGSEIQAIAEQMGVDPEDLYMKPTVVRHMGKAKVIPTPELKQPLGPKETSHILSTRQIHKSLKDNMNLMTDDVKSRMGPLLAGKISAVKGPVGSTVTALQSMGGDKNAAKFETFKAEVDKTFQAFRKDVTGAQAALKELGWLEPDYPRGTDPPDVFIDKTNEALKRFEEAEQLLLNLYSQKGSRVGDLRKGSLNPLLRASMNKPVLDPEDSGSLPGGADPQVDIEKEKALVRKNLGLRPKAKNAILAEFKRRTGENFNG